ncbi:exodeoxyribonuclease VII large subunit [Candidatus Hamiltonella endosymbiont of Tuberolachnus salignus]|uniref:exodeoxyribonuclease VII large subunit n=1 Tax=Candidatus Williamhamiltonella endosymbiont of Tuberolachnus salignus TaxID=3077954 RepID=UPI0030CC8789
MPLSHFSDLLTVSQLNIRVRDILEKNIGQIWLMAEISNFSQPSSGHWYFTLKDERTQVRCTMFRNNNRHIFFKVQNGLQVLVRACVSLYEPRGEYQLIVESMEPAGEGILRQKFEQLKKKLAAEGLFAEKYKKPLPDSVKQLGVITSVNGAALFDILKVLQHRDPSLPVVIYPTKVQGEYAPSQIVKALSIANRRAECDLVILARGGGSLEDLSCFNDERVARAIFDSDLPIVSAIGHETDVSIADLVADLRASTPSAAAERVTRDRRDIIQKLGSHQQRMAMAMDYYFSKLRQRFVHLSHCIEQQHPQLELERQKMQLIHFKISMEKIIQAKLKGLIHQEAHLKKSVLRRAPQIQIYQYQKQIQEEFHQLKAAMERKIHHYVQRFAVVSSRLETVSPLATLARGYSVTCFSSGSMLKKIEQVQIGDELNTRLQGGWIKSQVLEIKKN